jgi:hypothetical protein
MSERPERVVETLMAALQGGLETGAAALWSAMTPRARAPMGDLSGMHRTLSNELMAPLVGHRQHHLESILCIDDAARCSLRLETEFGEVSYLISLRRHNDSWQVTGLRREDLPYS